MALPNLVSAVLTDENLTGIMDSIAAAKAKLPFLIGTTKEERKRHVRIDNAAQPWSKGMLQVALQHPGMLPGDFKVDEMQKDVNLWEQLIKVEQALTSLAELVDNTREAVSVDAYSAALVIYRLGTSLGIAMEGLEELMDEYGKRFVRKSSGSSQPMPSPQK